MVAIEPTATYCLRLCYPKLLDHRLEAEGRFAEDVRTVRVSRPAGDSPSRFPHRCAAAASASTFPVTSGRWAAVATRSSISRRGEDVEVIETGTCCGMGGTFGLKAGLLGYDLSQAVGEPLFDAFRQAAGGDDRDRKQRVHGSSCRRGRGFRSGTRSNCCKTAIFGPGAETPEDCRVPVPGARWKSRERRRFYHSTVIAAVVMPAPTEQSTSLSPGLSCSSTSTAPRECWRCWCCPRGPR